MRLNALISKCSVRLSHAVGIGEIVVGGTAIPDTERKRRHGVSSVDLILAFVNDTRTTPRSM